MAKFFSKKNLFSLLATGAGALLSYGLHVVGVQAPLALGVATTVATGAAHYLGHVLGADVKVSE